MSTDLIPNESNPGWVEKTVDFLNNLEELSQADIIQKNIILAIAKGTGKLIKASIDRPTVWIEAQNQKIKDNADARSIITKAEAQAAAKLFDSDDELAYRALDYLQQDMFRKQANRESIAGKTIDQLHQLNIKNEDLGNDEQIDQDWLTLFWQTAENKSSEEIKTILAKILAGEICKPGSIEPKTLQVISLLTQEAAYYFQKACSVTFDFSLSYKEEQPVFIFDKIEANNVSSIQSILTYSDLRKLVYADLITEKELFTEPLHGTALIGKTKMNIELRKIPRVIYKLTPAGQYIKDLISFKTNKEFLKSCKNFSIQLKDIK
jgi:hypothetical protein